MRKEIELLKHHADLLAQCFEVLAVFFNRNTVNDDLARVVEL